MDQMNDTRKRVEELCDRAAYWSLLALVVLLPVTLNPYGNAYFDAPKGGLVRFLAMIGVAAWACKLIVAGRLRWTRTVLDWPLVALLASSAVATALALNRHISFYGGLNTFDGLLNLACYVALFYLAVNFVTTRTRLRNLIAGFLGTAAVISLLAVFERIGLYVLSSSIAPGGVDPTRSSATFGNPVHLGAYLTIVVPVSLALMLYLRVVDDGATGAHRSVPVMWFSTALLAVETAALVFTQGRAAWLGAGIGVAVTLTIIFTLKDRFRWRHIAFVLVPILAAGALYVAVQAASKAPAGESVSARAKSVAAVSSGTAFNRLYMWKMTLPMLVAKPLHGRSSDFDAVLGPVRLPATVARPLFGYGLDFYLELFPRWRPRDWYTSIQEDAVPAQPHNDLLQVAVGQGLVGLVAYLVVLATLVLTTARAALRSSQLMQRHALAGLVGAIVAYFIQLQFSFTVVGVAPFFWIAAGLAVSLAHREERASRILESELPLRDDAARIACVAVAVGLVIWGSAGIYRFVAADQYVRAAQDASAIGAFDKTLELTNAIMALNPNESRYPMVTSRFFEDAYVSTQDGKYADAGINLAQRAQRLDPYLTEPFFTEALIYRQIAARTGTNSLGRAIDLYRHILVLDPYNEDGLFNLALALYDTRSYQESVVTLKKALRLKPRDGDAYEALGAAYVKLREYKLAQTALERAVRLNPNSVYAARALKELKAKRQESR